MLYIDPNTGELTQETPLLMALSNKMFDEESDTKPIIDPFLKTSVQRRGSDSMSMLGAGGLGQNLLYTDENILNTGENRKDGDRKRASGMSMLDAGGL